MLKRKNKALYTLIPSGVLELAASTGSPGNPPQENGESSCGGAGRKPALLYTSIMKV